MDRFFTSPRDRSLILDLAKKYFPENSTCFEPFAGHLGIVRSDYLGYFKWKTNDIEPYPGLDTVLDYKDLPIPEKKFDLVITNPPFREGVYFVRDLIVMTLSSFSNDLFMVVPRSITKVTHQEYLAKYGWKIMENLPSSNKFSLPDGNVKRVGCRLVYFKKCEPFKFLKKSLAIDFVPYDSAFADYILVTKSIVKFIEEGSEMYKDKNRKKIGIMILDDRIKPKMKKVEETLYKYASESMSLIKEINKEEISHIFAQVDELY